jgi:peptidase M15-like protein
MSKRFATVTVAVALAWQIGPASAGPCDSDSYARQAKADTTIEMIEADVAVVQVKAETVVEPLALDAPIQHAKVQTLAKPATAGARVQLAKAVVSPEPETADADADESMQARAVTAPPKVVGRGNRRGLTRSALALLSRIETKFGPVNVISGYRPGARIAGTGRVSRHASGNAVDFDAGGRKGAIVKWLIANHKSGGTMTYRDMGHIHVDIGQHFVSLGANSRGGGSRRSYSKRRYSNRDYADRDYESRRYSGQRRSASAGRYGNGRGTARRSNGRGYSSGYATLYR